MDYISGPVILYSQDKVRMMDFLSDVFEFDVDSEMDMVQNGNLHLKLIELPDNQKENFQSLGIKFAFKLKNEDQLKEIENKYNFFLYRKSDSQQAEELMTCSGDAENNGLTIKDIDGRIWQFDVDGSESKS